MSANERAAYHEAGHAVMYMVQGRRFPYATIESSPEDSKLGYCLGGRSPDDYRPDVDTTTTGEVLIRDHIVALFAGRIAEQAFCGRAQHDHVGSEGDHQKAVKLAVYVTGSAEECNAYLSWLAVRTSGLVQVHREEIADLATALLELRTLSYDEALNIIRRARSHPPVPR
jgi:ATP-dependent Zn protease